MRTLTKTSVLLLVPTMAMWLAAAGAQVNSPKPPLKGIVKAPLALQKPEVPTASERWTIRGGSTTIWFDLDALANAGLQIGEPGENAKVLPDASARQLAITRSSTLTFSVVNGSLTRVLSGQIAHQGDLRVVTPERDYAVGDVMIAPVGDDAMSAIWAAESVTSDGGLLVRRVKAGFDPSSRTLTIRSPELRISPAFAEAMGNPKLADVVVGTMTIRAIAEWVGGAEPAGEQPGRGRDGQVRAGPGGCDMTYCQLYGLYQCSGARLGDIVGLGMATTSWNIGGGDCIWWNLPDEEHPFIQQNLFRLKIVDGSQRFEQIGMACQKDGFYALSSHQCSGPPCTYEPGHGPGGNWLGMGCTDTYTAGLNCSRGGQGTAMGPNYERNPWTGYWYYPGSHQSSSHGHNAIEHRLQVHDADLNPPQNPGATYYAEGYYLMLDDINPINSASWKQITINSGAPGGIWQFGMSGSSTYPNIGWAIDAWTGTQQTILAQEIPVVEDFLPNPSPDGRCVLAAKATDLGGGTWHYEYALLNVDMDRQGGSFSIPISAGTTVTNVGFHAVEHHEEPFNTADPDAVPIDNAPWTWDVTTNAVTWSTTTNPLRWAMMFNFRFDADAPPERTSMTLGLFRQGSPSTLTALTTGPTLAPCPADLDGDGQVNSVDLTVLLGAWAAGTAAGDIDGDGDTDSADLTLLLGAWAAGGCP